MNITVLGEAKYPSPIRFSVDDSARIQNHVVTKPGEELKENIEFELAGPRSRIFFSANQTRAGIVTCGGLCPGLNNVIRSIVFQLYHGYGVKDILGFRYGYKGLDPNEGLDPIILSPDVVDDIHKNGGTILGTSRGPVNITKAVDNLIARKINMLFTIGGDGTQRGANELYQEARKRGFPLSVVGIPKTVDNDVAFVARTFGYLTSIEEACRVIDCAHNEARSVENGISIVKLMGREAGFIAAGATLASQDVNFVLIPEVPFKLDGDKGFLKTLKKRLLTRNHAVIVVAEGAGQDLLAKESAGKDASGNKKLLDIGPYMKEKIAAYFKEEKISVTIRYIDPSYIIRSRPADSEDAIMCDAFARNAVHAAMAGKTGLVIGYLHDRFVHVPIEMLASQVKRVEPNGFFWNSVIATTGQPARFE